MTDQDQEFRDLLDLLCDGELDSAQQQRLAELLEDAPDRQREYLQYLDLHARMRGGESAKQLPIKSMTLKQLIVEFGERDSIETGDLLSNTGQHRLTGPGSSSKKRFFFVSSLLVLLLLLLIIFLLSDWRREVMATVVRSQLETPLAAYQAGAELRQGLYELPAGELKLKLLSGTEVTLNGPTVFELQSNQKLVNSAGEILVDSSESTGPFFLKYGSINFESVGSRYEIQPDSQADLLELVVHSGNVTVQPSRWQPIHYWNFDEEGRQIVDLLGEANGLLGSGTKRVPGLIGAGAIDFDNTPDAAIAVGSGGGQALGTGSFAVDEGITLEALILPRWSGKGFSTGDEKDYDEIIRKEGDGELRFLLSFQNDNPELNNYSQPARSPGPVLAFGLFLIGEGYHELEVPLSGENGVITLDDLKDGKPHHLVATYQTSTGMKQIFIDGRLVESYAYPAGTRPLTGGPGEVVLGNLKPPHTGGNEPFDGILDEIAFYNFALPAAEIDAHHEQVMRRLGYFESPSKYQFVITEGKKVQLEKATGLRWKYSAEE
ncbi:MAG: LamG domain-containing protein [Planctomycetaceae bacterium]